MEDKRQAGTDGRQRRTHRWVWAIATVLLAMLVVVGCYMELTRVNDTTNTGAAYYGDIQEMGVELKDFVAFSDAVDLSGDKASSQNVIIPGLKHTMVEGADGQPEECDDMVPQGVTVGDGYIFVSAYCGKKEHESVIYAIDQQTGELANTILLGVKSHVGGIAYDDEHNNLYFAYHGDGNAQVASFPVTLVKNYQASTADEYRKVLHVYDLPDIHAPSFMAYHDGELYVGLFRTEEAGVLESYAMTSDGGLKCAEGSTQVADAVARAKIPREVQGVTFYRDKILFSISYGADNPSELAVFTFDGITGSYKVADAERVIRMPNMMEQITAVGDELYIVFESASAKYSDRASIIIDRVCVADLNKLLA